MTAVIKNGRQAAIEGEAEGAWLFFHTLRHIPVKCH
jgi:hypothetical protein